MGLMKKLTTVVVTAGLLFSLVGTAFASYPADAAPAAQRLQDLGIVQGDAGGLRLGDTITRAELIKIIVWAYGKGNDAKFLKGAPSFPDTANHWASGEIALAKNMIEANGFTMGMPDGTFNPQGNVTTAQAVAFLMKFLGAPADSTKAWPNDYLSGAVAAGILSADDMATMSSTANAAATRGLVFYLADTAFGGYKLSTGKTVYTQYVRPTAPTLTVDDVAPTTDSSTTITGSVSSVYSGTLTVTVGSSTNVATVSNGKFTATVSDLAMGENSVPVMVTDSVGNVVTKTAKVTRTVGTATSVSAEAITVAAGESVAVTVAVKDAKGNVIADAPVAITSDLGTFDAATGKFTAGTKAGAGTATVTSGDLTTSVAVTVNAGALDHIVVTPATWDMTAGQTQKFAAAGVDAAGNTVALGSDLSWTASKGIMGADGTFGATTDASGTVTVTATASGKTGTASVNVFGVAAKVQIAAPAALVANGGNSETTLTATVVDANGFTVKGFTGTITFASSNTNAAAVETASVTAVNGVAQTTIKSGTGTGATVLSASASGLTGTTVTFTPTKQVASSVAVSGVTNLTAASGSQATLTLKLKDQTGNNMLAVPTGSNQVKVHLVSSDKTIVAFTGSSDNADVTFDTLNSGIVSKTVDVFGTAKVGAVTISGSVTAPSGSAITVASTSISTLVVGDAYQLQLAAITDKQAGNSFSGKVSVLDYNGNLLTTSSGNLTATITATDSDKAAVTFNNNQTSFTVTTTNGVGTFTYQVKSQAADAYTLKAVSGNLTSATTSFNVLPGTAYKLALTAAPDTIQASAASSTTLTVEVQDQWGNTVTDGSYAVTVKKTSGNGTASFSNTVVNTSNGEATLTINGSANTGTDTYTASATGLSGATETISSVIVGSPYKLAFYAGSFSSTAGADGYVKVKVQDAQPVDATYDNGRAVTLTVKDSDGVVVGTYTGTTANGVAKIAVNLTSADTYELSATADGLRDATGAHLTVAAADQASLKITAERPTLIASLSSTSDLTVKVLDQYGNTVTPSSDVVVTLTSSGSNLTLGSTTVTITGGSTSATLYDAVTAKASAGSITVTADSGTLSSGSVTITSVVGGPAAAMAIDTPNDSEVTDTYSYANGPYATVTVKLVDGNGNVVTTDSISTVYLASIDGASNSATVNVYKYGSSTALTVGLDDATNHLTFDKGQVKFYVVDDKADSLTLTFKSGSLANKAVTATFTAADPYQIVVDQSSPLWINGDGIALTTVTARVADKYGNTVPGASGTMNFSIASGSDYATLLQSSASIVDGEATVVAQSKLVTNDGTVSIKASDDFDNNGTTESTTNATAFQVEGTNPSGTVTAGNTGAVTPSVNNAAASSGVKSIEFQYQETANGAWMSLGTDTDGSNGWAAPNATATLTPATVYNFRAIIIDNAGRSYTTANTTVTAQ